MLKAEARARARPRRQAIRIAAPRGLRSSSAPDLLGAMRSRQTAVRAAPPAQSPVEILQGATTVAARLLRREGRLGVVAEGAWADLLLVDGDPTRTLDMFARRGRAAPDRAGRALRQDTLLGPA